MLKSKSTTISNPKLLRLAKDQECVSCGVQDRTIVSAHSNLYEHGRGMSKKSCDSMIMWLCSNCHYALDYGTAMSKEEKVEFTYRNICKTYKRMWELDLIEVKK